MPTVAFVPYPDNNSQYCGCSCVLRLSRLQQGMPVMASQLVAHPRAPLDYKNSLSTSICDPPSPPFVPYLDSNSRCCSCSCILRLSQLQQDMSVMPYQLVAHPCAPLDSAWGVLFRLQRLRNPPIRYFTRYHAPWHAHQELSLR